MTDGTDVPAGWYRDPLGSAQLRWWDATAWTEHVSQLDSKPLPPISTPVNNDQEFFESATAHQPDVLIIHPSTRTLEKDPATRSTGEVSSSAATAGGGTHTDTTAVAGEPTRASVKAAAAAAHTTSRTGFSDIALTAETWNALNRAITDAVRSATEPLVELRFTDAPTLVIDPRGCAYWWADSRDGVATTTSTDGEVATVARVVGIQNTEAGRDWEPLVWLIGMHSQPESFDPLSLSGARFKLRRWPNLTTLSHTTEQMSMTAMLGAAYLTVSELATLAQVEADDARRLISTFELMGLLTHTVDTTVDDRREQFTAQPAKDGIFSRLKARFSR